MEEKIDWGTKEKVIADINSWKGRFIDIRELTPSHDGEKIAAIVQPETRKFTLCINGKLQENLFDRMYSLRFNLENQPICLVYADFQWTVLVGDTMWENGFDMMWNLTLSPDTKSIAVNIRTAEMTSGVCLNDVPWENTFFEASDVVISPDGKRTASHVQIRQREELNIHWFYQKNFTVAVDGKAWDNSFLTTWGATFSSDSQHVASVVMTSDAATYSIAVDGIPWDKEFSGCWEPIFVPGTLDVIAPVETPRGWTLAENGAIIWPYFHQVYSPKVSPDGKRLAAIVVPEVGKWTVAIDGKPWKNIFNQMIFNPIFSPDGSKVATIAKHNNKYLVVVDDKVWPDSFENAWDPVFSPQGDKVALRAEKKGKFFIVANGKIGKTAYEWLWDPIFSPDGSKILIRGIENGKYVRRVLSIDEI
ncbi:electron transfer complex subunit TmcD [Thermodesulfobacterium hydrogeniphilum]|uniref:electron transfer complex subunit TmcD n=1 Tax=Thermodesulfobacterium hydrogeniphilum TaxID=161156 RepID=UPI000571F4B0|nr:hypothetical protein [Thermodesulfobacterium hydrogeniphilum]